MRATWLWTAVLLGVLTGCGEGRAIFTVDVFSFLKGTGGDTLRLTPDPLPPMPPATAFVGSIDVANPTSSGSLSYAIFLASDPSPAVVYGSAPALTVGPASFPAATTSVPINAPNLAAAARDLFKGSGLYVGVRASISNTGAAGLKTTLRLTQLQARVVIQDKIF